MQPNGHQPRRTAACPAGARSEDRCARARFRMRASCRHRAPTRQGRCHPVAERARSRHSCHAGNAVVCRHDLGAEAHRCPARSSVSEEAPREGCPSTPCRASGQLGLRPPIVIVHRVRSTRALAHLDLDVHLRVIVDDVDSARAHDASSRPASVRDDERLRPSRASPRRHERDGATQRRPFPHISGNESRPRCARFMRGDGPRAGWAAITGLAAAARSDHEHAVATDAATAVAQFSARSHGLHEASGRALGRGRRGSRSRAPRTSRR